ncbi:Uncharacterised protein [Amycolatopsis camponoti]|uniref:Uncharacterized protein n=1 Tax=Amycolatopsis camponoti TaxID=2606593 RepID=A0A6I8LL01_9PSEU|nr:hypothetical protein [Amycolatopsis camponoti]VVJ17642.1 Uncharacterised protein [Amycolatopsis camponoti]
MAVRIRSLLVSGPISVPLSTGRTVRLSPGQESDEVPDVEVAGSDKVEKLRRRGLIDVETVDDAAAEPAPERPRSRKRPDTTE